MALGITPKMYYLGNQLKRRSNKRKERVKAMTNYNVNVSRYHYSNLSSRYRGQYYGVDSQSVSEVALASQYNTKKKVSRNRVSNGWRRALRSSVLSLIIVFIGLGVALGVFNLSINSDNEVIETPFDKLLQVANVISDSGKESKTFLQGMFYQPDYNGLYEYVRTEPASSAGVSLGRVDVYKDSLGNEHYLLHNDSSKIAIFIIPIESFITTLKVFIQSFSVLFN